jgi:hypothetical protein
LFPKKTGLYLLFLIFPYGHGFEQITCITQQEMVLLM